MFKSGDKISTVRMGGCSYRDSFLSIDNGIATVKPTYKSYLFETLFQGLIWFAFFFISKIILSDSAIDPVKVITIFFIVCFTFSAIIRFIFFKIRHHKFFNKNLDIYYKNRNKKSEEHQSIKLSDIQTLYLISKDVYSSDKSYTSHELSFTTINGERESIIDHKDRFFIELEAKNLSKFLNVELEYLRNGHLYE